jgi:hypothetical protein
LIFVDERLAGIGGNCRPSTVSDGWAPFPAVALVGPRLAISVDDASDHHGPVVDIWAVD